MRQSATGVGLAFVLAAVAIVATHVWLLWSFGGALLLEPNPITGLDHETHISQTWRVMEGLDGWGRSWVYDVHHLAGFPAGTIFDADNKGWTIWTWAVTHMGVDQGLAFNSFVLAAHLLVPFVVYLAARWFGLLRWSSLAAAGFAVALWYFDSWLHWCWYVGMTAYDFVSYLFLLPLALFHRWRHERKTWQIVGVGILLAVCHLVHPYAFFLLALPMLAIYLPIARQLTWSEHAWVWAAAAFTVLANSWWLAVAIEFSPWILDSSLFGHTKPWTLPFDVLGLIADPSVSGIVGTRASFRFLAIGFAIPMLVRWRRRRDPRFAPLGCALSLYLLMGYFAGVTPLANIQPYRHVGPLAFAAVVPAAALLEVAVTEHHLRRLGRSARALAIGLAIPTTLWLASDVMYFRAHALPLPPPLPHGQRVMFNALGYIAPAVYEYGDWNRDDLARWLRAHDDGQGRVLVEGWSWGEHLTWKTDSQILGGFIWRNLEHSWANLFRHRPQAIVSDEELGEYVRDFGVRFVVISTPRLHSPWWDKSEVLQLVAQMDPFRIYKVRPQTSLFVENAGHVQAQTNLVRVRGTDPSADVVLRYHWLHTLRCTPDCTLQRETNAPTRVGFIRIPAPHPADFDIVNAY